MGVLAGFLFLLPGCHGAFVFVGVYLLLLFDIPPKGFEVNIYIYYTYTYPSIWSPPSMYPRLFSQSRLGAGMGSLDALVPMPFSECL